MPPRPAVGYRAVGVRDVELTAPIEPIEAGVRPVATEWILVRSDSEPLGAVRLQVPPEGLDAPAVEAAVRANLDISPTPDFLARRAAAVASGMSITVAICTKNNPDGLRRCLESLLESEYPHWRALVVDNAPEGTAVRDVAAEFALRGPVDHLEVPTPGLSNARNGAIAATSGEILAFLDDDEIVDRYWLSEVVRALHEHPEADVVTGVIVPAELSTPTQELFEEFGGHSKGRGFRPARFGPDTWRRQHPLFPLPPFGTGANMVFTPRALSMIGGFDPALGAGTATRAGEDTHAFTRVLLAGGTIVYQPSAITRHRHRETVEALRLQLYGYGLGLTAFYASLLREKPGLVWRLLALTPRATHAIIAPGSDRNRTLTESFPTAVLRANLQGMLRGPFVYIRTRRRLRHTCPRGAERLPRPEGAERFLP